MSSPGTTSYRLPIVTIGLSLTVFTVLRMFQETDIRTELVEKKTALCTKVHRPPKMANVGPRVARRRL